MCGQTGIHCGSPAPRVRFLPSPPPVQVLVPCVGPGPLPTDRQGSPTALQLQEKQDPGGVLEDRL